MKWRVRLEPGLSSSLPLPRVWTHATALLSVLDIQPLSHVTLPVTGLLGCEEEKMDACGAVRVV